MKETSSLCSNTRDTLLTPLKMTRATRSPTAPSPCRWSRVTTRAMLVCDLHWLTVQLSTGHILRAVLRPGPGQQLVFRAVTGGGICRSEATWQPPPRLTSHSEQISRYCQWWRRGHNKYCLKIVLRSVSLFLIIPPKQSRPDVTHV